MNDLISVIVPVYKVEEYLDRCVESIVNQTYRNLEIILVDDGSPDNCPQMCDEWAKRDSRIKVIHKANGGLSDARNAGLDICSGQYIGFVDSDDYIALNMYEQLYSFAIKENVDVVMCGSCDVIGDHVVLGSRFAHYTLVAKEGIIRDIFVNKYGGAAISVCTKLFKKEVIGANRFDYDKTYEDAFFSLKWIGNTKKFGRISDSLYFYVQHGESITHQSKYSDKILDVVEAYQNNLEIIREIWSGAISAGYIRLYWAYRVALDRVYSCVDRDEHWNVINNLQYKIRQGWRFWLWSSDVTLKGKIAYILMSMNVGVYMWVRGMVGK